MTVGLPTPFDPVTATDDELSEYHALDVLIESLLTPERPNQPLAAWLLEARTPPPPFEHRQRWRVFDDRRLVAIALSEFQDVVGNRERMGGWIGVHPDFRRQGIGTELLKLVVGEAERHGCRLVNLWSVVDGPGDGFTAHYGLTRGMVERVSKCPMAGVDPGLLTWWIERAEERATDYELVAWDGPVPDDLLAPYCELMKVMNTAPTEELDWSPEEYTPEQIRESEKTHLETHDTWWTVCARHKPSGEFAGFTDIGFPRSWSDVAWQGNTGVWPKHRDRGIGRWLKATTALRILTERPAVDAIYTWNAGSNEPMLAINEAMGFRPAWHTGTWQKPTDELAARLGLAGR